jgi:hypothetical protein
VPYCPNCNAELKQGDNDDDEQTCWNCGALVGGPDAWKPLAAATGPVQPGGELALSQANQNSSTSPAPTYYRMLNGSMLLFFWAGNFFSIGVTVLFVLYHWLLYDGGGTSGVPLAFSWMFSVVLYGVAVVLYVVRGLTPYASHNEASRTRQAES